MPKIRRRRQRKDYRVADAAKKNPENETEEIVVTEDVEEMDDLDAVSYTHLYSPPLL